MTEYRFFQGSETSQKSALGGEALDEFWYYEPTDYEGDVLWSAGFPTRDLAEADARKVAE